MARDLNDHRAIRTAALALLFAAVSFAHEAAADEALPDPTRPPAALITPAANSEQAAAPVALQSVILRKGHKPIAIIGGERVELGQSYQGARLVKVTESEVVLAGPSGRETLRLTPSVDKTPVQKTRTPHHQKSLPAEANEK